MKLKPGVRVFNPLIAMSVMHTAASAVFARNGYDCIVTALQDAGHSYGSIHYAGFATDFRTKHLPTTDLKKKVEQEVKDALGVDYDVVLEHLNGTQEHLHVEWQPKTWA